MTLFKITCDTCRTSLNVRQKSAIGQILACPKCGSMVQVKPPPGWESDSQDPPAEAESKRPFVKPVPDPTLPETVSSVSGSVAEGLSKPKSQPKSASQASGPAEEKRWQGESETGAVPSEARSVADINRSSPQPDLPGDHWDSSRARQRRKLLFAFTSAAAILVFGIAAIIFAALQFAGGDANQQQASENSADNQKLAQADSAADPDESPVDDSEFPTNPDSETSQPEKSPSGADGADAPRKKGANPDAEKSIDDSRDDPSTPADGPVTNDSGDDGPDRNALPDKTSGKDSPTDDPGSDAPPGFNDDRDAIAKGALPDFFRELDEFSVMFEQDEPLLKLREAFTEKDLPGSYGLSRYFVSRDLKRQPNPDLALNVPLASVKFEQTTLLEFIDFFYQLTGVPVAVDVTPVMLAGIRLDQKFDFTATGKSTRDVLDELARQLGLRVVQGENSLVLTIPDRDNLVEASYPVGDLAATAAERQQLIAQLQSFINRRSWSTEGGVGIATANDQQQEIVVKHYGWAQVRVREFLRHARVRHDRPVLHPNPNFPDDRHRLKLVEATREKPVTLLHADPVSLSRLAAQLASEFGVHVFINWEATGDQLLPSGNLPLSVSEEPFGDFIQELAEGVKLELVWHAPGVVELTSSLGASSNLTFESYDIRKAVSPSFTPEKLLAALQNLLVSNDLADFDRATIDLDSLDPRAIYAVLPQSAHLNVLKILRSAESVAGSE